MTRTVGSAVNSGAERDAYTWRYDRTAVDWAELSELYRVAPLGEKPWEDLAIVFGNSRFTCFIYAGGRLIGAGRALADGLDCSYIADVAIHPDHQGKGLGRAIVEKLIELSSGHRKILLYANPGTESFYHQFGFLPMRTAMAIFRDPQGAITSGVLAPRR